MLRRLSSLALALTFLAAAPAPAQFGARTGFEEAFKPDYLARDISLFNDHLELEEWQRPIVEILLDDYAVSFQAGMDAMREQMAGKRDEIVSRGAAGVMPVIEAWTREKVRLREEFLTNVKSQLSETQNARWPRFERAFRREKSLHLGELSGESVNILALVRDVSMDSFAQAAVEPILASFELELDEALQAREAMMAAQQPKIQEAMVGMNTEAGVAAVERIIATRIRVRDVNDRAAEAIAAALPPEARGEFLTRWRSDAYASVFRASPMERVFQAATALPELTEEQRSGLAKIRDGFDQENDSLAAQALTIVRSDEPKEARRKAEAARVKERTANRPPDLLTSVNQQREQLNERTQQQIEALLGPELSARIPNLSRARTPRDVVPAPDGEDVKGRSGSDRRMRGSGTSGGGLDNRGSGSKDSKAAD
jgi:hypothetical protein